LGKGLSEKKDIEQLTYKDAFLQLQKAYLKLNNSESYKKYDKLNGDFANKAKVSSKEIEDVKKSKSILEWVKNNLEKTNFKTFEEATTLNESILAADFQQYKDNEEFYVLMFQYVNTYGVNIYTEVIQDFIYAQYLP
jgi:hypothetical protein